MWDEYGIYVIAGFIVIGALLTIRLWGDVVYYFSKHWRLITFVVVGCSLGALGVVKQQHFKYELAYMYFTGTKNTPEHEARYQVRLCKEFVLAKVEGRQTADYHIIAAGPIPISNIHNWEYCARVFGLNFWKHDISINGQDGGRLLCEAYARDTYRSGKVNTWCSTVFAPESPREVGT